jgi:hypothetical protein
MTAAQRLQHKINPENAPNKILTLLFSLLQSRVSLLIHDLTALATVAKPSKMICVCHPSRQPAHQRRQRTTRQAHRHLPIQIYNRRNKAAYPQCLVLLHHVQVPAKEEQIQ